MAFPAGSHLVRGIADRSPRQRQHHPSQQLSWRVPPRCCFINRRLGQHRYPLPLPPVHVRQPPRVPLPHSFEHLSFPLFRCSSPNNRGFWRRGWIGHIPGGWFGNTPWRWRGNIHRRWLGNVLRGWPCNISRGCLGRIPGVSFGNIPGSRQDKIPGYSLGSEKADPRTGNGVPDMALVGMYPHCAHSVGDTLRGAWRAGTGYVSAWQAFTHIVRIPYGTRFGRRKAGALNGCLGWQASRAERDRKYTRHCVAGRRDRTIHQKSFLPCGRRMRDTPRCRPAIIW